MSKALYNLILLTVYPNKHTECFGPAVLILALPLVLLGMCTLTFSCSRLLGNPSNLCSCLLLFDFFGSPLTPIYQTSEYAPPRIVIIFTCVHLRTKEKVLFICISLASFLMLGKYHSINICWKSEQISWETQFPFGLPPYSGWKHECISYDHFPGCGMLSFSPR